LLNYKLLKTYPNLSNIPRMGRLFLTYRESAHAQQKKNEFSVLCSLNRTFRGQR